VSISFGSGGTESPPEKAVWLGALGLIPSAALTVMIWGADEAMVSVAAFGIVAYGAVVLSFLGGAHWGFAGNAMKNQPAAASRLLVMSVVPSLMGWVAVLLPTPWSVALLAVAFVAILPLDRWALRHALAPRWWLRLRIPLSATVSTLLLLASASAFPRAVP